MKKYMMDLKFGGNSFGRVNMYLIVIYDIKQEENYKKRQKMVFKICKRYLKHIQKSVFEGELDRSKYLKFSIELKNNLNAELDSCIIFSGRNNIWMKKEFITKKIEDDDQFI